MGDEHLLSLCYTLQVGREAFAERAATSVDSMETLKAHLAQWQDVQAGNTQSLVSWICGSVKNKEALQAFSKDAELGEAIEKWLVKGKYDNLLDLWAKGLQFDWQRLYQVGARPARISLPNYPFAEQKCWLEVPEGLLSHKAKLSALRHAWPNADIHASVITTKYLYGV